MGDADGVPGTSAGSCRHLVSELGDGRKISLLIYCCCCFVFFSHFIAEEKKIRLRKDKWDPKSHSWSMTNNGFESRLPLEMFFYAILNSSL